MARRRRVVVEQPVADEDKPTYRDAAMARLAAARVMAQSALDAIDDALGLMVEPDDDAKGKERRELMETALESAGGLSRALECAQEDFDRADPVECEPWDEDGDDDEGAT